MKKISLFASLILVSGLSADVYYDTVEGGYVDTKSVEAYDSKNVNTYTTPVIVEKSSVVMDYQRPITNDRVISERVVLEDSSRVVSRQQQEVIPDNQVFDVVRHDFKDGVKFNMGYNNLNEKNSKPIEGMLSKSYDLSQESYLTLSGTAGHTFNSEGDNYSQVVAGVEVTKNIGDQADVHVGVNGGMTDQDNVDFIYGANAGVGYMVTGSDKLSLDGTYQTAELEEGDAEDTVGFLASWDHGFNENKDWFTMSVGGNKETGHGDLKEVYSMGFGHRF
jgi:hypothetical protein